MPKQNRTTLKNFFKNGSNPTEAHFRDLIDSTINKIDDGFAKNIEDGLRLSPLGTSSKLVSFYENVRDTTPNWQISVNPKDKAPGLSFSDEKGRHHLFLKDNGNTGIGTLYPRTRLDVRGTSTLKTRIGGEMGKVPADKNWHVVIDKLNGCHAFEIVAKVVGRKERGQYAMAHAIATSAYGKGKNKIRVTQSHFGSFWNKLKFRWRGEQTNYRLEVRTRTSYFNDKDHPIYIHYHITNLWDDRLFFTESPTENNTGQ